MGKTQKGELRVKKLTCERKISYPEIAKKCGFKRAATVSDKMNMKYEFKIGEILKIKNAYFPEYSVEQLVEVVE